jgi:hypothetical protein
MALPPGNWSLRLDSARAFVALSQAAGESVHGSLPCAEARVCVLVQSLQGG